MTPQLQKTWLIWTAIAGVLLMSGCTQTYKLKAPTFTDYPEQREHPLTIALLLDEEYSSYVCEVPRRMYRVPLGDALEKNSIFIAEQTFEEVHMVRGSEAEIPPDARAVLTPKVIYGNMSKGVSAFDRLEFVIDVEWTLKDRRGNMIWLKTMRGKARNAGGTIGTIKSQAGKRIRAALKELFAKTHQAIAASPEIRAFAESQ